MAVFANTFEGGTSGATITTAGSGGGSGDAFDSTFGGTSLTYDSTHSAHGSMAAKISTSSAAAAAGWTTSLGGPTQLWFRCYVYFASTFSGNVRIITSASGGTKAATIVLNSAQKLILQDSAGTTRATSTTVLATGQWYRLEGYITGSATAGQIQVRLYASMDSATPTETITTAATINTLGALTSCFFGHDTSTTFAITYWMDDVAVSTTTYLGPALSLIPLTDVAASRAHFAASGARDVAAASDHISAALVGVQFTPTFRPMQLDGAEMLTMADLHPTTGVMVAGGDVEGIWTSPDRGSNWHSAQNGVYGQNWRSIACVAWSKIAAGTIYACAGKTGADGGFMVSTDGGASWTMKSTAVQFLGNNALAPLPTTDAARSTGNLIAQDTVNKKLYVATYAGGIAMSSNGGASWSVIGLAPGTPAAGAQYYPRTIVINPSNPDQLWAGCYDWDGTGTYGKVWTTSNASQGASSTWTQEATAPATIEELKIIGNYRVAACGTKGIWYRQLGSTAPWASLNGSFVDTTKGSVWTSVDGWVDGSGSLQIVAACGSGVKPTGATNHRNVIRISVTTAGAVSYTDLTATSAINVSTIPPDYRTWWRSGSTWHFWLGGVSFTNPHVLVDPANPLNIYIAGAGGVFRTSDGGANWETAVNGMLMCPAFAFAFDPADPLHMAVSGGDFPTIDITDGVGANASTVTQSVLPAVGQESHATCFDPADSTVYIASNAKYGLNANGIIYTRPQHAFTFTDIGYPLAVPAGNAPIGLLAARDAAGARYLLAAAQGAGVWRWDTSSWAQMSGVPATGISGANGQRAVFAHNPGSAIIYLLDRAAGVYRSNDYGRTWTLIFAATSADSRAGWIAVSPLTDSELWVSTETGLWRLTSAATGTVAGGQVHAAAISGIITPGAIAFDTAGGPYVLGLPGPTQPGTKLWHTVNGGATWQSFSDPSLAQLCSYPRQMTYQPANGRLYVASDTNFISFGQPAAALTDSAGAADSIVISGGLHDAGAALATLNVTSPPSASIVLSDIGASADDDGLTVGPVYYPQILEAAGATDGIKVVASSSLPWQLTATAGGTTTTFVTTTGQIASAGVAVGESFQLYSAGPSITQPQVFTITAITGGTITFSPPALTSTVSGEIAMQAEMNGPSPLPPANPAFIRSRMPRVHAQNLLTGKWLHRDVQGITSPLISWALGAPGTFTGVISPPRADLLDPSGNPLFAEWQTAFYLEEADEIKWGGILTDSSFQGPAWSFTATEFTGYPNGMPYEGPKVSRTKYDALDAVRYIWDWLQSQPGGNLSLELARDKSGYLLGDVRPFSATAALSRWADKGTSRVDITEPPPTGPPGSGGTRSSAFTVKAQVRIGSEIHTITYAGVSHLLVTPPIREFQPKGTEVGQLQADQPWTLDWWNSTDCGQEISSIQAEAIFDFWERHTWTDASRTGVRHKLLFGVPRRGSHRTDLRFAEGENIVQPAQSARAGSAFANNIVGVGAGQGSATIRGTVAAVDSRLRRTQVYNDQTVTREDRMTAKARRVLESTRHLDTVTQITVRDSTMARLGTFGPGDDIPVTMASGWRKGTVWSRITAMSQDPTTDLVTLTLARSDSFTYMDASGQAGSL